MDEVGFWLTVLGAAAGVWGTSIGSLGVVDRFVRRGLNRRTKPTLDAPQLDAATLILREELSGSHFGKGGGGAPSPSQSPTPAELAAIAIMQLYVKELITEANRIAKRARADRPSKDHVRQAADRIGVLRDRAGVASDLLLAVGSILIGGAVAYQINLWTGGQAAEGTGVWISAALAVGVGMVVAAGTIKWRRS